MNAKRIFSYALLLALCFVTFIGARAAWEASTPRTVPAPPAPTPAAITPTAVQPPAPILTSEAVASHATAKDCWIIVHDKVYDVSAFLSQHPGGTESLLPSCGNDATQGFETRNRMFPSPHSQTSRDLLSSFYVGEFASLTTAPPAP